MGEIGVCWCEGGRGREGQSLEERCTKRWVGVLCFFVLAEGGWRKGKEGGVLSPDVRQRVEKQCVPKRCLHLECVSAAAADASKPQYTGLTGGDNKDATPLPRIKPTATDLISIFDEQMITLTVLH